MHRNGKAPQELGMSAQGGGALPQELGMSAQGGGVSPQDVAALSQGAERLPQSVGVSQSSAAGSQLSVALSTPPPARPVRRHMVAFSSNASIARRLASAQIAIDTVLADSDLQALLAAHGYDAARMRQGQALREQALALYQQQRAKYGDLYAATDVRAAAHAQAHAGYMRHVKIAQVALRDDRGAVQKLGLAARRTRTQAGWLLQAQQFYANALADAAIVGALAEYGVTRSQLTAGQQQVAAVVAGSVTRQTQKGAAQATTRARDAALAALNRWMRDFLAIARVALAGQPRRLEQLCLGVAW